MESLFNLFSSPLTPYVLTFLGGLAIGYGLAIVSKRLRLAPVSGKLSVVEQRFLANESAIDNDIELVKSNIEAVFVAARAVMSAMDRLEKTFGSIWGKDEIPKRVREIRDEVEKARKSLEASPNETSM